MAPASFFARGSSSAFTSSIEASPPDAITGIATASRKRDGGVEVETLEQAVARDIGVDDGGDARVLEAPRDVEHRHLRGLRPAFDRDLAVARVEPDRDAAGELSRRVLHQLRIAHRRGADDHAR